MDDRSFGSSKVSARIGVGVRCKSGGSHGRQAGLKAGDVSAEYGVPSEPMIRI
jgi:hypothetical protein